MPSKPPKSPKKKYHLKVQMSLSEETGKLLEDVAEDREMTLSDLAVELIFLGLQSLKHAPLDRASALQAIDSSHEGRYSR